MHHEKIDLLHHYLRFNRDRSSGKLAPYWTQLYERFAKPMGCFMVFLIGVPLGARFNRRGPLVATAAALGLLLSFWMARQIILPFGEGDQMAPWLAAWLPYAFYAAVGTALFARLR